MYKYLEDFVGNTPLVKLKRIPGNTSNTILVKLEGNNPAGSVKDRPALSMIARAEARGDIKPGDTLIEATSGNTGIALAMAAAMKEASTLIKRNEWEKHAKTCAEGIQCLNWYMIKFLLAKCVSKCK
jgi:cysteine synthase B